MASPPNNFLNQLVGGLGSIQNQGSGFFDKGFGQIREQQMHAAQQQMNELARHQLDALRYGMSAQKIVLRDEEPIPKPRPKGIRAQLQAEIDEWLAPITL